MFKGATHALNNASRGISECEIEIKDGSFQPHCS